MALTVEYTSASSSLSVIFTFPFNIRGKGKFGELNPSFAGLLGLDGNGTDVYKLLSDC